MVRTIGKSSEKKSEKGGEEGKTKGDNQSNTTETKSTKPSGCISCEFFKQEGDKSLVERGIGGRCSAKPDTLTISQSVVRDKSISNNCPIYSITIEKGPSCKECDSFIPERSIEKIRSGTGGYCGFNKSKKIVPTHISNNDTIPNDCPKYKKEV